MNQCRLCENQDLTNLINFGEHPIAHRFLETPNQDEYTHKVDLAFCESCGLIQLVNPIPAEELYTNYFCLTSWKPQPHMPRLCELIKGLEGVTKSSKILEVGCNNGVFIESLKAFGFENILGVEPAQDAYNGAKNKGFDVIDGYFTEELASEIILDFGKCDLLIIRQVLEHITDLEVFGRAIRAVLHDNSFVLIEVPNFNFSLNEADYTAIWEEHVNYFTFDILKRYLNKLGINVFHDETADFSGQALIVLGKVEKNIQISAENIYLGMLKEKLFSYKDHWPKFCHSFKEYLKDKKDQGKKIAIYGAGCRACSLLNFAGLAPYIDYVLDDQTEKQGKYMPGSRLLVSSGEKIGSGDIDLCMLAVNSENDDKVIKKHQRFLDDGGEFIPVLPKSNNMLNFWKY